MAKNHQAKTFWWEQYPFQVWCNLFDVPDGHTCAYQWASLNTVLACQVDHFIADISICSENQLPDSHAEDDTTHRQSTPLVSQLQSWKASSGSEMTVKAPVNYPFQVWCNLSHVPDGHTCTYQWATLNTVLAYYTSHLTWYDKHERVLSHFCLAQSIFSVWWNKICLNQAQQKLLCVNN